MTRKGCPAAIHEGLGGPYNSSRDREQTGRPQSRDGHQASIFEVV
jgi:hypothetical protein